MLAEPLSEGDATDVRRSAGTHLTWAEERTSHACRRAEIDRLFQPLRPPGTNTWLRRCADAGFEAITHDELLHVRLSERMLTDHLSGAYGFALRESLSRLGFSKF